MAAAPVVTASTQAGPSVPGLQPFQCAICSKRFTRHENLKRHVSIHTNSENSTPFPCAHCSTCFSRQDLRRRHVKRKHPEVGMERRSSSVGLPQDEPLVELDEAMGSGVFDFNDGGPREEQGGNFGSWGADPGPSTSVSRQPPPSEALTGIGMFDFSDISTGFTPGRLSIDELSAPVNRSPQMPTGTSSATIPIPIPVHRHSPDYAGQSTNRTIVGSYQSSLSISPHTPLHTRNALLDPSTVATGVDLFFSHVAHYCPFIHQPTFDVSAAADVLLLAMLAVSMQFGDDSEEGKRFGRRCSAQARKLVDDMDETTNSPALNLQTVQACLLLQLCAVMLVGGSETKHGLRLHARCIELVRLCGLTEPYPSRTDSAGDLDALWGQFARAESHKRTFYGVYQLDATWYQVLSTPRHMSHLEIKHEMPCSEQLWSAPSVTAWAHRTLVDRSTALPRYIAAVRNCLTPSPQSDIKLDAHGSLLVIFFLLSSVREVSGWSTMTGRVCFERFEALHASLKALEPGVCGNSRSSMDLFTEAMWHMSMMDLLLWSPAHTQGVVEYSIDAAIAAAIHFGISQPVAISVESLNPHLEWFLTYLNSTSNPNYEPPWITIYAFKAALVAWQLVKSGLTDHVESLGVVDAKGMCAWIKRCFECRRTWGIGRLVLNSMDELEMASR